jgi:hypothetical protein
VTCRLPRLFEMPNCPTVTWLIFKQETPRFGAQPRYKKPANQGGAEFLTRTLAGGRSTSVHLNPQCDVLLPNGKTPVSSGPGPATSLGKGCLPLRTHEAIASCRNGSRKHADVNFRRSGSARYSARLPKALYSLPIDSLRCFADGFPFVGTLGYLRGCRNVITLTKVINSIVGHARLAFGVVTASPLRRSLSQVPLPVTGQGLFPQPKPRSEVSTRTGPCALGYGQGAAGPLSPGQGLRSTAKRFQGQMRLYGSA